MPKVESRYRTIGRMVRKKQDTYLWKIPGFLGVLKKTLYPLSSPVYRQPGSQWRLTIYPNVGRQVMHLRLWRCDHGPAKTFRCTVGMKRADGVEKPVTTVIGELAKGLGRSVHYEFPSDVEGAFLSSGALTFTICVREEEAESRGMKKCQLDYNKLLKSGSQTDVLIVVSGREFRAHQCVLRARWPVFDAMFEHETEEKKSGKVIIDDLDPDAFRDFLEYLYTGSVGHISDENVSGLYIAADKYNIEELASEAVLYMQRSLSVESFCDVMTLAFQRGLDDLMHHAVDFFKNNLSEILATEKWQTLMRENGPIVNKIFMTAIPPVDETE